jgi:methionyl-tRNA formyltransferase
MDTGPLLASAETSIGEGETAEALGSRLAEMGARLLVETILLLEGKRADGRSALSAEAERVQPGSESSSPSKKFFFPAVSQDGSLATYCPKITREDGLVDWTLPALTLVRRDRAFTPWPGLFTFREKTRLKIAGLTLVEGKRPSPPPGTVLSVSAALVVACGEGSVAVGELQAEGRRKLPAAEFARGERVLPGEVWPS